MKTLIQDKNTNEFYAVEMTEIDCNSNKYAGDSDFPYWTTDVNEAYDFGSELIAYHEMSFNDLTNDGTRIPEIVTI